MIFKLRVFLRLLQSIFGSARRTSPFLIHLIAAYFKLNFGFGTRKWPKSRTATKDRNASSRNNTESTNKKHAAGHRFPLFHSSHISKLPSDISEFSSKTLAKVKSFRHARKSSIALAPVPSSPSGDSKATNIPDKTAITARVMPNMEVVQKMPPVETPEFWRKISAPARVPEQIPTSEWRVQGRKRRTGLVKKSENNTEKEPEKETEKDLTLVCTPSLHQNFSTENAPRLFYTFENPYKVLEDLDDDAFQVVKQRNFSTRQLSQRATAITETQESTRKHTQCTQKSTEKPPFSVRLSTSNRIKNSPITASPIKIPGLSPAWNSTQILASGSEKHASTSPEPVKFNTTVEDLDIARIIKNRRRQNGRSPTQTIKKAPMAPTRDTVDSFRKASSPPRYVSLTTQNAHKNEWKAVQNRRRATGYKKEAELVKAPIADLRPYLETSFSVEPKTVTMSALPVILYKSKRAAVTVSV